VLQPLQGLQQLWQWLWGSLLQLLPCVLHGSPLLPACGLSGAAGPAGLYCCWPWLCELLLLVLLQHAQLRCL
jgi:hypothetical protein